MEYNWYYFWMTLKVEVEKISLENDDFENARNVKKAQLIFEKMSEIFLNDFEIKEIAKIWVDFDKAKIGNDYKKAFNHFENYLYYATDRMNLNRWLYCKLAVNYAFDLVYKKVDAKEWYEKCSKCDNNGKTVLDYEVEKWINNNFMKIYKKMVN